MCEQAGYDVRRVGEDREAFECLYVEHIDLIQAFLARRVSDPSLVADLTSEVFLAAIESARKYRPERGTPTGWLYGIRRHVKADEVRHQQRQARATRRMAGRRLLDSDAVTVLVERLDSCNRTWALSSRIRSQRRYSHGSAAGTCLRHRPAGGRGHRGDHPPARGSPGPRAITR